MNDREWLNGLCVGLSLRTQFHIRGRWRLFPFPALAAFLPHDGVFVDIGCGHGLWGFYMARLRPQAIIVGIDPDEEKIALAEQIARRLRMKNTRFVAGAGEASSIPSARFISAIDVLYLLPYPEQERLLARAVGALEPGGRLLLKEMSERPRWKFVWNWLEEWLAVRMLGLTLGRKFYFRTVEDWRVLLASLGLSVTIRRLDAGYLHPHVLFVGEKKT